MAAPTDPGGSKRRVNSLIERETDQVKADPYRYRRKLFSEQLSVAVDEPGPGAGVSRLRQIQQSIIRSFRPATSTVRSMFQPVPLMALIPPVNFRVESRTATTTHLAWENRGTGGASVEIDRALGDGSFSNIATVAIGTLIYNDSGLVENTRYRYRARTI